MNKPNCGGAFQGIPNTGDHPHIVITPLGEEWKAEKKAWDMTLQVLYNGVWAASLPEGTTWATIKKRGEDRLDITLQENATGAERSVDITFAHSDDSQEDVTFTITQAATNAAKWDVTPKSVVATAAGGKDYYLTLTCPDSKRWKATSLNDWIRVGGIVGKTGDGDPKWDFKNTGMGAASVRLMVYTNTTGAVRRGKVTFTQDFLDDIEVWVEQAASDPEPESGTDSGAGA